MVGQVSAALCGLVLLVLHPGQAAAEPPSPGREAGEATVEQAREVARQANRAYSEGNMERALELYRQARQLRPAPKLLFNMAQCERRRGRRPEAVALYEQFLKELPGAPNAPEVEQLIRELRAGGSAAAPGTAPAESARVAEPGAPPGTTPSRATAPAVGLLPVAAAGEPGAVLAARPPGSDGSAGTAGGRPWYRRWYVWAAAGAVVIAVVAGSAAASSGSSGSGLPPLGTHAYFGGGR
jgi:tetratricopeptide (TPR) repeat protein